MRRCLIFAAVSAFLAAVAGASDEPGFSVKPTAARAGETVTIRFAVTAPVDVEVAILGADGKVVRHLAAGLLGPKAPAPLRPGLSQALAWDGTGDDGRMVPGAKVRVRLGMRPKLDRIIGWSGQKLGGTCGLTAGPDGTLYVIHTGGLYAHRQNWLISAFDKDGRYLRQLFPGPANLAPERREGWPRITLDDGAQVPVIWHLLPRTTYPGAVLDGRMFPVVTRDGRLVTLLAHRGDKNADLRGGRRLMILGTDGSVPANFLGPEICPRADGGGFGHIALSPDEKHVYATGFVSTGRKAKGHQNVVYRLALDGSEPSKVFIGTLFKAGSGPGGLNDPQGIDVDAEGNLYVADHGNNRIAVFTPGGAYLDQIRVERPDTVRVSRKTGAVYVVQIKPHKRPITDAHWYTPAHNWWATKVVKFGGLKDKTEKGSWTNTLRSRHGGGGYLALDESGAETVLWVGGMSYGGGPIMKFVDWGRTLELLGAPIDARLDHRKFVPLGYIGDVSVIGDKVLSQHPAGGNHSNKSLIYSAATGEFQGYYIPRRADGKMAENMWSLLYGDVVAGADGNMYYHARNHMVRRYDITGRQLPFPDLTDEKGHPANYLSNLWHGHMRGAGLFVDRSGTLYVPAGIGNRKIEDMKVKVIGADGKVQNDCAVHVQNARMGGIAVDRAGNIYLGAQAAPKDARIPEWFAGKLPADSPAHHPGIDYKNYGTLFKFPPTGGAIVLDPAGAWTAIAQYRHKGVSIKNAIWSRRIGYIGSHGRELGCHCETTRFDLDGYDRVVAPDLFRFRVYVLDANGNEIAHFGGYGNMDSRGPGSPVPEPEIPFAWPLSVECANEKIYVADVVNKRIVAVRFEYAATGECPVP